MNRIEKLQEMLQSQANDCFLLHAQGLEYFKIQEPDLAIQSFQKVIQEDENYVGTYYHLAKVLEFKGLTKEAIEIYEKGIVIATQLKDHHARNELQMALDDLVD